MATDSKKQEKEGRRRALALGVGLFLFAVYLLTYRGGFHSIDEVSMFAVTESLVKFGRFNSDQIAWTQWTTSQREAQGFFGTDGHVYSKKGLGMSLAMAPLYWLGLILPGLGMLQAASLLNLLTTAVTAALLVRLVQCLGYDDRTAIGVGLFFGLATIAWVYTKYLFSEPLAGLLLLASAYLLIVFRRTGGNWRVVLAGLLAGLAVLTRANNLFLIPVFGAYLLAIAWERVVAGSAAPSPNLAQPALRQGTGFNGISLLSPVACFLLGLIPPAFALLGYNWIRAGDPLQTGYDLTIFSPNLLLGMYKLLFSPLRGLFVYSPLLLLSVPGLVWLWRRHRPETALAIGLTGVTIVLFSVWSSGEGLSWGSRFLVPVVPFLCLALAPVLRRGLTGSRALVWLILGLGGLSCFVQFLGIAINPWVYLADLQERFGGEFFLENTPALTDFRYLQVIGQLRSWSLANSDLAWWQPWGFNTLAFGLCLGLVIATTANLKWTILHPSVLLIPTLLVTYVLLSQYLATDLQFGPPGDGYTRALNAASAQANPGEAIVTVAPYHYHVPMNRFKTRLPLIGFAQSPPPLPETALPLLEEALKDPNAWLITVGMPPAAPDNAVERWLAVNAFKASDDWFEGVRLARYGVADPPFARPENARFGDELQLLSIATFDSIQAGTVLPVELVWQPYERPGADYHIFLHLLAGDGRLVAQHDAPPNGGYTPTSSWAPGMDITDRHGLALPADFPAGDYWLVLGMYNPTTGQRLPVDGGNDFVEVGPLAVGFADQ